MRAARIDRSARLQRVLAVLADRAEHSTLDIAVRANVCAVNSCIAELRENGFRISCRQEVTANGERRWYYRLEPADLVQLAEIERIAS